MCHVASHWCHVKSEVSSLLWHGDDQCQQMSWIRLSSTLHLEHCSDHTASHHHHWHWSSHSYITTLCAAVCSTQLLRTFESTLWRQAPASQSDRISQISDVESRSVKAKVSGRSIHWEFLSHHLLSLYIKRGCSFVRPPLTPFLLNFAPICSILYIPKECYFCTISLIILCYLNDIFALSK